MAVEDSVGELFVINSNAFDEDDTWLFFKDLFLRERKSIKSEIRKLVESAKFSEGLQEIADPIINQVLKENLDVDNELLFLSSFIERLVFQIHYEKSNKLDIDKFSDKELGLAFAFFDLELGLLELSEGNIEEAIELYGKASKLCGQCRGVMISEERAALERVIRSKHATTIQHQPNREIKSKVISEYLATYKGNTSKSTAAKILGEKYHRSNMTITNWLNKQ